MKLSSIILLRRYVLLLPLLISWYGACTAQPQLIFKRLVNNWPTIEAYFTVTCNGNPEYFTDKRFFRVAENGVPVSGFELWCPDATFDGALSVALVFDVSSGVSGPELAGMKAAGNAFIDQMNGTVDEASIFEINDVTRCIQSMTTSQNMLHNAVNSLTVGGRRALWDGLYFGLLEIINNGVNNCRSVIVVTNGWNNAGSHTQSEAIALANRYRIRVFTIGLGPDVDSTTLQLVADESGGRYYATNDPSRLTWIYEEISKVNFEGFQECLIQYTGSCRNGSLRTVDLSIQNFCDGNDSATRSYTAPLDTFAVPSISISLGGITSVPPDLIRVPVVLGKSLPDDTLHASSFTLRFDSTILECSGIDNGPGSLLEGTAISARIQRGAVLVAMQTKYLASATGRLFSFVFRRKSNQDSVRTALTMDGWNFSSVCYAVRECTVNVIVRADGTVAAPNDRNPGVFALSGNYPNPVLSFSRIDFTLPSRQHVRLALYDLFGRLALVLADEDRNEGKSSITLPVGKLSPGVYFYRLDTENGSETRSLVIDR